MSHRALVVVSGQSGWLRGETVWREDRTEPPDGWRPPRETPFESDSLRDVVGSLDFARFDGMYRRAGGEWTAFLACWLAVEHYLGKPVPEPCGDGAVVAIYSPREETALRTWLRGAKATVADAVRANELSIMAGRRQLLVGLRQRAGNREMAVGKFGSDRDSRRFCDRTSY
ncbi:Uncharacterized protein HBNXHr_1479 [Halorhabdus sp. BNX81]|nr:Uncharacterized protein HBNXHr_1479 [Halorhabdus sp. BNX81]